MSTRVVRAAASTTLAPLAYTNAPFSLVGLARPPLVTSGVGAFVYGAWVQLKANIGANANGYAIIHVVHIASTADETVLDIGTGGAGSEVAILTLRSGQAIAAEGGGVFPLTPTVVVPSGSRVAARCATNGGNEGERFDLNVVALAVAATLV